MENDLLQGTLTRKELANALRVTERTIANYEKLPNGLPSLTIGGRRYYRIESVKAWLDARETRPNPRR